MAQWLRFHTPRTGCLSLIPGQKARPHMPQQRLKIPCAASKTWCSQTKQNAEVKSTQRKSIRVKTPVALSAFTALGYCHLHLVLKCFSTPKGDSVPISSHLPPSRQPAVCTLSLWIHLFWIFYINGTIEYVAFHLACFQSPPTCV